MGLGGQLPGSYLWRHLLHSPVHSILRLMAENDKILAVEDDRNLLDTLKYNLRKEGYKVVTAVDGAEALDVARREKPDLIILDIWKR